MLEPTCPDAAGTSLASMDGPAQAQAPLVELDGVTRRYGTTVALHPVQLDIARGEFVVLLGPSGSGKTTLLSLLGGFAEPSAGRVRIGGHDVTMLPPAARPTATVFQDYALFPHLSVEDNVAFGLRMRGVARNERRLRAGEMLALVGLGGYDARGIHQLSGGQRQRVALARALAVAPQVLLLDEPLGALDLALRRQMQEELVRVQKRLGTTFVHVTHDQEEAMSIADRIVVMSEGRIRDIGTPERVYLRPANRFTATFMGESNLLAGVVQGVDGGAVRVRTALGDLVVQGEAPAGASVDIAIRPEQLHVLPAGPDVEPIAQGRVCETSFQGSHVRFHARVEGAAHPVELRVRAPVATPIVAGGQVTLGVRRADPVLLVE